MEENEIKNNKIVENIIKSWNSCYSNHIYIENITNLNYIYSEINTKKSLFISNCENMNIKLCEKINHIKILNCKNVLIEIKSGVISGISIFHSDNIIVRIINKKIDLYELSFSTNCCIVYDLFTGDNTYINTNYCYECSVIISDINTYIKHSTNKTLFSGIYYYLLKNTDLKLIN
jgi:hypothetical protein